jgi:acyl-CoA synthetase (AMP-forming)/AMP-acid ligase II
MIKTGLFTNRDISLPENFRWITVDKSKLKKPDPSFSPAIPDEDAVIMLQYSSGSTGTPKGTLYHSIHSSFYHGQLCISFSLNLSLISMLHSSFVTLAIPTFVLLL